MRKETRSGQTGFASRRLIASVRHGRSRSLFSSRFRADGLLLRWLSPAVGTRMASTCGHAKSRLRGRHARNRRYASRLDLSVQTCPQSHPP